MKRPAPFPIVTKGEAVCVERLIGDEHEEAVERFTVLKVGVKLEGDGVGGFGGESKHLGEHRVEISSSERMM